MPARTIVNGSDSDVTVNTVTVEKRRTKTVTVLDADLATWVGTSGIAVLANAADYQTRRNIARRLRYNVVDEATS